MLWLLFVFLFYFRGGLFRAILTIRTEGNATGKDSLKTLVLPKEKVPPQSEKCWCWRDTCGGTMV